MKRLPFLLVFFRLLLAFIIPLLTVFHIQYQSFIIVVLIILGLLSDVFDGVVARKLNMVTPLLRKLDSNIDVIFTIGILITVFKLHSALFLSYLPYILPLLMLEGITYVLYWLKFKKQPANHSYLTKAFGLLIFANFCLIIGWGNTVLFISTFIVGTLSYLDGYLILFRLTDWKTDNKSVFHLE